MDRGTRLVALVGGVACGSAWAADPVTDATRALALLEYDAGHLANAAARLCAAAELGDARATEVLALMHRYGEWLYGDALRADRALAQRRGHVATALPHPAGPTATALAAPAPAEEVHARQPGAGAAEAHLE